MNTVRRLHAPASQRQLRPPGAHPGRGPGAGEGEDIRREDPGAPHRDARLAPASRDPGALDGHLRNLFACFSEFSRSRRLPFVLAHRSLLGWYWGKERLPWDDHLDVCVSMDVLRELDALQGHEGDPRYRLEVNPHRTSRGTLDLTARDDRDLDRIDARFIDRTSGLFVGITGLASAGTGLPATSSPHVFREDDVYPLRAEYFGGIRAWVPRRATALLREEYGRGELRMRELRGHRWWPALGRWLPVGRQPDEGLTLQCLKDVARGWDLRPVATFRRTVAASPSRKALIPVAGADDAPIPFGARPGELSDEVIFFMLEDVRTGQVLWGKKHSPERMEQLPLELELYRALARVRHAAVLPRGFSDTFGLIFGFDAELFHGTVIHAWDAATFLLRREQSEVRTFGDTVVEVGTLGQQRVRDLTDFQVVRTVSGLKFIDFTIEQRFWGRAREQGRPPSRSEAATAR